MKQKISTLMLATILSSTFVSNVFAADFQLQNIRVGGLGCPSETTQVILAPDSSAASIIFQQFESRVPNLEVGPKVQRNISTLNCNIFLDIKIPAGIKLDSIEIGYDMRGFATFDRGVQGSFRSYLVSKTGLGTEINSSRNPEVLADKSWSNTLSNQEEDFTISAQKIMVAQSQCARGSSSDVVSIRLQNTLSSQIMGSASSQSQGSITMDSSDIRGGLKIRANTSSCRQSTPTIPGNGGNGGGRNCRIVRGQQVCS